MPTQWQLNKSTFRYSKNTRHSSGLVSRRTKNENEVVRELKNLKNKAEQINVLEKKLEGLLRENEDLRQRVVELEVKTRDNTRSVATLGSFQEGNSAGKKLSFNTGQSQAEIQISALQKQLKETEAKYAKEFESKKKEYDKKIQNSQRKFERREKELKEQLQIVSKPFEASRNNANNKRSGSPLSRSDRSKSAQNFKRLLDPGMGGLLKDLGASKLSSITATNRPSDNTVPPNLKHLEQMMSKVLGEYKQIKTENKTVNTKLDKIQKVLSR